MGRKLSAVQKSDQHATDVRVQDRHADSVAECEQRGRGVGADARQEGQVLEGQGDFSAVLLDDRGRAGLETQGAGGVSEVCPSHNDVGGGCGRHVRRRGPAFHPLKPDRLDACDGRLLAHDLKDEGPPVGDVGCAHWQVALVCREPLRQVAVEYACGLCRWIYEHSVSLGNKTSS